MDDQNKNLILASVLSMLVLIVWFVLFPPPVPEEQVTDAADAISTLVPWGGKAVAVMIAFAEPVSRFIERHPTVKILALSFLILIGVLLVAEGAGQHVNKGYVYFAMAFSLGIEFLNMRFRKKKKAVELHNRYSEKS